jgi:hypothetical protein
MAIEALLFDFKALADQAKKRERNNKEGFQILSGTSKDMITKERGYPSPTNFTHHQRWKSLKRSSAFCRKR